MTNEDYIALGKAFEIFLSNERFRVLGTACLGQEGYQHIGMEVWTQYPDFPKETNESNKSILMHYVMGMAGKGKPDDQYKPTMEELIEAFK